MEYTIRDAIIQDVDYIAQIHIGSWRKAYNGLMPQHYIDSFTVEKRHQLWTNIISRGLATVLVAESNSVIVGFLCYGQPKGYKNSDIYELSSLYVKERNYGCGIGSALYRVCEQSLQKINCKEIKLWALDSNLLALSFYQKQGFIKTGETAKESVGDVQLNDLELAKIFPESAPHL